MIVEIFVFIALFVFALIDWRYHELPSFITTAVILALCLVARQNIVLGLAGAVFGLMLYEFDFLQGRFFGGVADVKTTTIIGFTLNSITLFGIFMILTALASILVAIGRYSYYKSIKKPEPKEFPMIPVLFFVYLALMLIKLQGVL